MIERKRNNNNNNQKRLLMHAMMAISFLFSWFLFFSLSFVSFLSQLVIELFEADEEERKEYIFVK